MRTSSRGPGRHSTAQEGASWKCTWSVALTVHICIIYVSAIRYVIKGPMAISILFWCIMSHWSSCAISNILPGTPKRNTLETHIKNTGNYFRGAFWISHTQSRHKVQTTGSRPSVSLSSLPLLWVLEGKMVAVVWQLCSRMQPKRFCRNVTFSAKTVEGWPHLYMLGIRFSTCSLPQGGEYLDSNM